MPGRLSLPALLSHAYVAFTIEFDNEFEHRVSHRTTLQGRVGGADAMPWLVSMAMWRQVLRYVPPEGIAARDLYYATGFSKAALKQWVIRLSKWWGYLKVSPDLTVSLTPGGLHAREAWLPLEEAIERRWIRRFGEDQIGDLRSALAPIFERIDPSTPDFLPILGFGLFNKPPRRFKQSAPPSLADLLARTLLAFALEFEEESEVSLPVTANILRLMRGAPVRTRDLPAVSGISKEAISVGLAFLQCKGYLEQVSDRRTRWAALTEAGKNVATERLAAIDRIEKRWTKRFGAGPSKQLRDALEVLVADGSSEAPVFECLTPYPDGWRAVLPKPQALPHFPVILHRGGYPDGS